LVTETGTLGVRVYYCERHIISREQLMLDLLVLGNKETVLLKSPRTPGGKLSALNPSFEDLKRLAEKTIAAAAGAYGFGGFSKRSRGS
jgi:uncharacterized protein (DUF111 family)